MTHVRYNEIRFPLRTGPDSSDGEKIDEMALAKVFAGKTCVNSRLRNAFSLKEKWVEELRDQNKVKVTQIPASQNVSGFTSV